MSETEKIVGRLAAQAKEVVREYSEATDPKKNYGRLAADVDEELKKSGLKLADLGLTEPELVSFESLVRGYWEL